MNPQSGFTQTCLFGNLPATEQDEDFAPCASVAEYLYASLHCLPLPPMDDMLAAKFRRAAW